MNKSRLFLPVIMAVLSFSSAVAQNKPAPVCSEATFAALKPLPKLEYECSENLADYDSRVLKLPRRR